jgi:phospho-N-acetylmuramoyl-pentapeptide-transferase
MVPSLLLPLSKYIASFRVFESITLRALCAGITAFLVCFIVGEGIIDRLRALRFGERIESGSDWLAEKHRKLGKGGTPTMGGMIFVLAAILGTVLFARLSQPLVLVGLWTMTAMGVLGGYDDRIKLLGLPDPRNPGKKMRGMRLVPKLVAQSVIALVAVTWLWFEMKDVPGWATFRLPVIPGAVLPIGVGVVALGVFTLVGISNAVNLTDGLDGLAAGCGTIVVLVMTVVAYLVGRVDTASYLGQVFVPGAGEMTVFLAALAGAVGGFLWWNCHPAKVFMGNTGSLALGGALAIAAVGMRQEILLFIAGFAFVWEALSVILQVASFRYRGGKRIFLIAPYHHHLEKLGWPESRVVMSFWISSAFLGVVALGLTRAL